MPVSSPLVRDEVAAVEMVTGMLLSTAVVSWVLASELAGSMVLTGIIVPGVLPSMGGEVFMLVPSAVVAELT